MILQLKNIDGKILNRYAPSVTPEVIKKDTRSIT